MHQQGAPESALLSTKLRIPAPRRGYIVRRGLFDTLARWQSFGVVYIKGAAGMGKTTLVSSFIMENRLKTAAWLSLDAEDSDLLVFWHDFAAAVSVLPGVQTDKLAALLNVSAQAASVGPDALAGRVREAMEGVESAMLVLDDLHLLCEDDLLHSLEFFIRHLPENLHLLLLSREDPAFYLGGLAVEGKLLFIDGAALRLSEDESTRFLTDTLGIDAKDGKAARLAGQAEGWIGGLQLLAAADGMGAAGREAGRALTADYVTHEIFATLSEEERRFLTVTSILPYFDIALCGALLGEGNHKEMIGRLMAKNLFLTCVDEASGIYRYHNILGDYLRRRFAALPAAEQAELHKKAAAAFLARHERMPALPHLLDAGEFESAGTLLGLMGGNVETWHFLNRLPLKVVLGNANLAIQSIVYNLLVRPDLKRARQVFRGFKACDANHPCIKAMGQVGLYFGEKIDFTCPPTPVTPEQIEQAGLDPVTKALAYVENASLFLMREDYENSAKLVARGYEVGGGINPFVDFYLFSARAQLAEETGELNECLRIFDRMAETIARTPAIGLLGIYHAVGRTGIYLKQMDRERAASDLVEAGRGLKAFPDFPFLMTYGLAYNQLEYDLIFGDPEKAEKSLRRLLSWSSRDIRTILTCDRLLVHPLVRNRLPADVEERFLLEYHHAGEHAPLYSRLVSARILWRRGEQASAMQTVNRVLAFSREHGNRLELVYAGLLKAELLLQSVGESRTVQNLLREALHEGWENHLLLPFFVERFALREAMGALSLEDAAGSEQAFLQDVLRLYGLPVSDGGEPLSAREQEVLRELASGLTNPQIAKRLFISLATVKTHLLNIYGKLGVSSRVQAAAEARRRGFVR